MSLTAAHCFSTEQWWNKNWQGKLHFEKFHHMPWGTRWCSWLKNRATSWKAAGLSPNGVTRIFHWLSFQPHHKADSAFNINEYKEYFLAVKDADAYGWQPNRIYVRTVMKSGRLNLLESSGPVQGYLYFPFTFITCQPACHLSHLDHTATGIIFSVRNCQLTM